MKKTLVRTLSFVIVLVMALSLFACGDKKDDPKDSSNKPTEAQPTAEQPTEEQPTQEQPTQEQPTQEQPTQEQPTQEQPTQEQPTASETQNTPTPTPGDDVTEGMMVYYQDFNSFSDTDNTIDTMKLLGWKVLYLGDVPAGEEDIAIAKAAPNNNTGVYTIEGGKLHVDNSASTSSDSFVLMLPDSYMKAATALDYTIEYKLSYTEKGGGADRYCVIVYNYDCNETGVATYYSNHLRICGYMDSQLLLQNSWQTRTDYGMNIYANDTSSNGLLKRIFDLDYNASAFALAGKDLTLRVEIRKLTSENATTDEATGTDITTGIYVYLNGSLISQYDTDGDDSLYFDDPEILTSSAIVLKPSKKIEAYIDSIAIFTGVGACPENTSVEAYVNAAGIGK